MMATLEMRDLTDRLLAYEAGMGKTSDSAESDLLRVYEKLRRSLVEFVGIAGFQSLASRALSLTKPEAPGLAGLRIASDGSLEVLGGSQGEIEFQIYLYKGLAGEVGILFIVRLLDLIRMFIGEALTLSLLRDAWPGEVFGDGNVENGRKA